MKKNSKEKLLVGIVGLGYVGLPLAREFYFGGASVLGFDINSASVKMINSGKSPIKHIQSELISRMAQSDRFEATDDMSRLSEPDAILIAVPTPLTENREPDMSYVVATCEAISKYLRKGQLVVLESTTYPGTTRELMLPILERSGLKAGKDFYLAYSPEREDPGNPDFTASEIPKVVGGIDPPSLQLAQALYSQVIVNTVPVSSCEVADSTRLLQTVRGRAFDRCIVYITGVVDA